MIKNMEHFIVFLFQKSKILMIPLFPAVEMGDMKTEEHENASTQKRVKNYFWGISVFKNFKEIP